MQADDRAVVRAEGLGGVEEVLETGAGQTRFERVRGLGVFFADEGEEGRGQVAERVVGEWAAGGTEVAADEAGEDGGDDGGNLVGC